MLLEKEKGIPVDYMIEQIKRAIVVACKNLYGNENIDITMDAERNNFSVKMIKTVVEEIEDETSEILLEDAKQISKRAAVGKEIGIPLDPKKFGRIAVSASKNVIHGGIRDGEKGQVLREFQSKLKEIVTATVERIDPKTGNATIRFGKAEAVLPVSEQVGEENLKEGDNVKIYIVDVRVGDRGPKAIISRTHPDFVRKMFETEVPEIFDGIVEIKSISREAGSRTKMAVISNDPAVDAVGACIGNRGARVGTIVEELGGEKIDIIVYDEDPAKFIAAALAPASVVSVQVAEDGTKSCKVTVPDSQLSLAIGNKGQNARLAAKLTGWKIDIRPESGFYGEDEDDAPATTDTTEVAEETNEAEA